MGIELVIATVIIVGILYDEFEVEKYMTFISAFFDSWTAHAPSKLLGVNIIVASGLVISAFGLGIIMPTVLGTLDDFRDV